MNNIQWLNEADLESLERSKILVYPLGMIDTPPFLHFDLSVCILLFEIFITFIRNAFGLSSPRGTHLPDEPKIIKGKSQGSSRDFDLSCIANGRHRNKLEWVTWMKRHLSPQRGTSRNEACTSLVASKRIVTRYSHFLFLKMKSNPSPSNSNTVKKTK